MYNGTKMLQVGINKSLLKEYKVKNDDRVVYLENGKEFQLQIYNPTSFTVAAEIYLNGTCIPNRLVLRPAERVWLDRYLDKAKKFKFETYEVDGDVKTQKIIEQSKNGEIQVKFYREDTSPTITYSYSSYRPAVFIESIDSVANSNYGNVNTTINVISAQPECCEVISSKLYNTVSTSYSVNEIPTSYYGVSDPVGTLGTLGITEEDTIETGYVKEGSDSSQKFQSASENFNTFAFNTETIKIIPLSQKPVTVNDIQKCYCPECGHRLKNNYKFCPYCGSKIDEE